MTRTRLVQQNRRLNYRQLAEVFSSEVETHHRQTTDKAAPVPAVDRLGQHARNRAVAERDQAETQGANESEVNK